ncbi:MAG: hypothetical protein AAB556_02760 [Patescibacteria group bacterium]
MFGIVFSGISTFCHEISSVIGKFEVGARKESVFTMGFLNYIWAFLFFLVLMFVRNSFVFSLASLPTFATRVFLEILQTHSSLMGVVRADRTTFSFVNVITIPFLLLVDTVLGYKIGSGQIFGIGLIFIALFILFLKHDLKKDGLGFVLFSSINAVATISLFKYNITHFNSVEAEQTLVIAILLFYLFFCAKFLARENPIKFFAKPIFLLQSATSGIGNVIASFAYVFAPASVILSAKRSFSIIWSWFSGSIYFHEKHVAIKLGAVAFLILGVILLV